jgi:hypothetical protein
MRMFLSRFSILIAGFSLVAAAGATQIRPLSIEDLSGRAERIVHGRVLSKSVQRDSEGRIFTRVELTVIEHWRGAAEANRFTIVHAGGVLGERGLVVSGGEEFGIDEEVVVFVTLNGRGEGVCVGMAQGKFKVTGRQVSNGVREKDGEPLTLERLKARATGGAR